MLSLLLVLLPSPWALSRGDASADAEMEQVAEGQAIDPARQAEYYRLHDECMKLAKRQLWDGVARLYLEMEATGAALRYDDYVAGAMAARHAGDVLLAYERLQAAAKLDGTREVIDWLWTIDTQFGRVELRTDPQAPASLEPARMPMLPDQRAAVEHAQAQLAQTGAFVGFLPAGDYSFAGQGFTVQAGPKEVLILVRTLDGELPEAEDAKRRRK
ncbi:MAG: hypothetical protein VX899_05935 [Myxococcota bacterium]|nr:hypothetical protein [Myxococcota bacterium]